MLDSWEEPKREEMPGKNGIQILDEIKDDVDMSKLKVVIYSGEQKF